MTKGRCLLVVLGFLVLLPTLAAGGAAKVEMTVVDEGGATIEEVVIFMTPSDDPSSKTAMGEGEPGRYAGKLDLSADETEWTVAKVVADGYLPVMVSIESVAAGETIQKVDGMELNPGIPIPPLRIMNGGTVRIDLIMGEQSQVMAKFLKGRAEARAKVEREAAEQLELSKEQEDYAAALKLYNEGDIAGSLPYFEKAIEQKPEDVDLRVMYARVLYKATRHDEFHAAAEKALQLDPGNRELRMMQYSSHRSKGDLRAALGDLLAIRAGGGGGDELLPHLQFVAQSLGRTRAAIPAYEALLEMKPNDVDSCVALASIYAATGESALSDRYLAKAIEIAPERAARLYFDLASPLLSSSTVSTEALSKAIALLRKAIEQNPNFAHAHKKLGLAMWKRQDWAGTREAFERYLELSPSASDREQIEEYLSQLPE